jgi:hypothetical protein
MVNRLWHQFYGRGLVNPVDDMHKENLASHPELLTQLAEQFIASDFDVKHLIRAMCNSESYQRTSKPLAANRDDAVLFSKMPIKAMTPEQLYDSLEAVLGRSANTDRPRQQGQQNRGQQNQRDAFIAFFQGEEGALPTEYQGGVPQALRLMNANQYNNANSQLLREVKDLKPEQAIERLYLGTLSRRPNAEENQKMLAHYTKAPASAGSDILWVLLNCSEFTLNH